MQLHFVRNYYLIPSMFLFLRLLIFLNSAIIQLNKIYLHFSIQIHQYRKVFYIIEGLFYYNHFHSLSLDSSNSNKSLHSKKIAKNFILQSFINQFIHYV